MKLVQWMRFTWDLERLGEPSTTKLPVNTVVRPVARRECEAVIEVLLNSFTMDSDWAESFRRIRDPLVENVRRAFTDHESPGLVLVHGPRIVGASIFTDSAMAENHLISGPCILLEYRNRGLGTDMLYRSLSLLKQAGVKKGNGMTRKGVPAEKFVYPKFGGEGEPAELPAPVAP